MNNIDSELDGDLGHSLPNAEEVKTEAALLGNAQKRRNRLAIILIGSVLVLGLVIGVSFETPVLDAKPNWNYCWARPTNIQKDLM